jgi:hypothetical protein
MAKELQTVGFIQNGPFRLKRTGELLNQFIELQPGHQWLEGKFTANLCWKITAGGEPVEGVYDFCVRIGFLFGENDVWFSHDTKEELDVTCEQVMLLIRERGLPFLDSVNDLEQMVEMYEAAVATHLGQAEVPTSPLLFFGRDEGWKHYNLACAYRALGDSEKARTHFSIVLEQHSHQPLDWVQNRKRMCIEALASSST